MKNSNKLVNQKRYAQNIGSHMCLSNRPQPADIAYAIFNSPYTSNPSRVHWIALEKVFRHLKDFILYYLRFVGYLAVLKGYNDVN